MSARLFLCLFTAASLASGAHADSLLVPAEHASIQAAVLAAQDGDTVLVAPGTYLETLDFLGKAIEVTGTGGAELTILDAGGLDHGVRFVSGEGPDSVLRGFTVRNASTAPGSFGVYANGASPTLRELVVRDNHIAGGGCLEFIRGGGIGLIDSAAQLSQVTSRDNSVTTACIESFAAGAGVFVEGASDVLLEDCELRANLCAFGVPFGGGMCVAGGNATLRRVCVLDNSRTGLFVDDFGTGPAPSVLLEECRLELNGVDGSAGNGLSLTDGSAELRRCVIARNGVIGAEAGVGGTLLLDHCTTWGNGSAPVFALFFAPPPVLSHCIVWNGALSDGISGSADVRSSIVQGGWPGEGNLDVDPLLRDPDTGDFRLLGGSPAIDAGDPAVALDPDGSLSDLGAFVYEPWIDLGHALPDATSAPRLAGTGALRDDTPLELRLTQAEPGGVTQLVIGFATLDAPFHGGVLVPAPALLVTARVDALGEQLLRARWPAGSPSAFSVWVQHWLPSASAPLGFAASNALVGTTP